MSTEAPPSTSAAQPGLQKTLGPWQILFYGLGSMLGAGIYALVGRAADSLGNAIWLAFFAAMVAALLTGLSYACVGSRHPKAGGAAYVTQRAMRRPWLSYVVGIAVMMSGLTSMATGSQAIAENLDKAFQWGLPNLQIKFVAIALVLMVGGIIYRGIRESMWANIVCTVVEATGLIFIIAVGVRFWGSVNYLETPGDTVEGGLGSGITLALVLQGAVLMFFSFIGFEDILNVSEEVKNPRRDIPFGLIGAMILATLIYMAVAITAVSVVPWKELAGIKSAPLVEVAKRAAPWFQGVDKVYIGISIFAIGNTALLNYLMGSRLLYGMSRQGLLPQILGSVHPRRQTPHVAIGVLFVIVTALILSGGVKALAESTVLLLLTVFTIVNIALVILKRRQSEPCGGFEVPVIIPILGAVVCASLVVVRVLAAIQSNDFATSTAPLIAGAVLVVAVALYFIVRPKHVMGEEEAE